MTVWRWHDAIASKVSPTRSGTAPRTDLSSNEGKWLSAPPTATVGMCNHGAVLVEGENLDLASEPLDRFHPSSLVPSTIAFRVEGVDSK